MFNTTQITLQEKIVECGILNNELQAKIITSQMETFIIALMIGTIIGATIIWIILHTKQ